MRPAPRRADRYEGEKPASRAWTCTTRPDRVAVSHRHRPSRPLWKRSAAATGAFLDFLPSASRLLPRAINFGPLGHHRRGGGPPAPARPLAANRRRRRASRMPTASRRALDRVTLNVADPSAARSVAARTARRRRAAAARPIWLRRSHPHYAPDLLPRTPALARRQPGATSNVMGGLVMPALRLDVHGITIGARRAPISAQPHRPNNFSA